jgi:pyruvate formate lyase activating enzyme
MATTVQSSSSDYEQRLADGRVQCQVCPRHCRLREGQRGFCFVRGCHDGHIVLWSYGEPLGLQVDPIEKKPLYHFLPGAQVLSFGSQGCNLACRFCQNWKLSRSRELHRQRPMLTPTQLATEATEQNCRALAYTYNDPVIFLEYATDVGYAAHEQDLYNLAVTAGYITDQAREDFFAVMDAANVDLKSLRNDFYRQWCGGQLAPVLETLLYLRTATSVWLEVTTLLIPGLNDETAEITALCEWIATHLGCTTPLHFSAFHPAYRLSRMPITPLATLQRARSIAQATGLQHVYLGNVHDPAANTTVCTHCGAPLITRIGYRAQRVQLHDEGYCLQCGQQCVGFF